MTGVSGSGKSSLVNEILLQRRLAAELNGARCRRPASTTASCGVEQLDKVIAIDQSPIGRTPRSNPATYTGLFADIRDRVRRHAGGEGARLQARGASPSTSRAAAAKPVRATACSNIEMHFLPDVYVTCDVCKGTRYNRETLEVKYKGKNIYDVLEMTVDEALRILRQLPAHLPQAAKRCHEVGLGYIKIGQASTTLSGGEAQRVKLATELSKRRDRPHASMCWTSRRPACTPPTCTSCIEVLNRLVDAGNTVVVIEHNLDLIKNADYIIDMGPEGGDKGGTVVGTGTPEELAANPNSYTGQYLKPVLEAAKKEKMQ